LVIRPIDRYAAIVVSLFISFQIKSYTMLCWLADNRNPQLEEIVSNFEITKKISALLDESSSLMDVV